MYGPPPLMYGAQSRRKSIPESIDGKALLKNSELLRMSSDMHR